MSFNLCKALCSLPRDKLIANPATTITCRLAGCQLQVWQLQVASDKQRYLTLTPYPFPLSLPLSLSQLHLEHVANTQAAAVACCTGGTGGTFWVSIKASLPARKFGKLVSGQRQQRRRLRR